MNPSLSLTSEKIESKACILAARAASKICDLAAVHSAPSFVL